MARRFSNFMPRGVSYTQKSRLALLIRCCTSTNAPRVVCCMFRCQYNQCLFAVQKWLERGKDGCINEQRNPMYKWLTDFVDAVALYSEGH